MVTGNGLYINIKNKNHTFKCLLRYCCRANTVKLPADTTETLADYSIRESATISRLRHEEKAAQAMSAQTLRGEGHNIWFLLLFYG